MHSARPLGDDERDEYDEFLSRSYAEDEMPMAKLTVASAIS